MKYRAEIDGLRAVAVIPVVLFHAGIEAFNGGFVGVDVFFVISGYLITSIILTEKEQGRFSLLLFYERRARRILPSLFLVMLVTLPFAWVWLLPQDMRDFCQSLIAVSTFVSNILFWQETGYWGTANELKPLLHTWSLAVEEQYYVLFPLFLMLMWKLRRRWILGAFAAIAVVSLAAAQWGAYHIPSANFFLLHARIWELAIGAGIAFFVIYRQQAIQDLVTRKYLSEMMCLSGLLMIGYAVYAFDETTPFPSVYAFMPTLGAGLIILFGSPQTLTGRLLGAKPLVGIGLISYSAYLWHQPLFAFARYRSLSEPSEFFLLLLAFLSFPLAYLSWKYVERPFRKKRGLSRKAIAVFSVTCSVVYIVIGISGYMTDGFVGRKTHSGVTLESIEAKRKLNYGLSQKCEGAFTLSPDCRTSDEPEILVWGDSFAMHLVAGIMSSTTDARIIQMTKTACGPFFDIAPVVEPKYPESWARGCLEFSEEVRRWLTSNSTVKYAVVSSPFDLYLAKEQSLLLRNGDRISANFTLIVESFLKTLGEIQEMGITPIVFSPPPANGVDLGRCLAKADWMGWGLDLCNFRVDEYSPKTLEVNTFLETISEKFRVVRLDKLICDEGICRAYIDDVYIYRDKGHLSYEGAAALGRRNHFYSMIVDGDSK